MWTPDQEAVVTPPMLFTNKTVAIIWGMQPRAVQVRNTAKRGEEEGAGGRGELWSWRKKGAGKLWREGLGERETGGGAGFEG